VHIFDDVFYKLQRAGVDRYIGNLHVGVLIS
jgi:hypothetical protein